MRESSRPSKGLPIVDADAGLTAKGRARLDGAALASAQRLLDEGRGDEAKAILAPLAEDPATAVRAHACLLYAGLHLMAGAGAAALAALDRLPEAPAFPVDEGYRRMIEACALRQVRRYDDALAAALKAVAVGTTTGRALVLADTQKHAGKLDDAARTLTALLERDPHNVTALAQLAGYQNLRGDLVAGAALFDAFRAATSLTGAAEGADARRNEAFYFATRGDLPSTLTALHAALLAEPAATRGYIDDEVELDRFRTEGAFQALVATGAVSTETHPHDAGR